MTTGRRKFGLAPVDPRDEGPGGARHAMIGVARPWLSLRGRDLMGGPPCHDAKEDPP